MDRRRPSEEQLRQGCVEFWLFCQRWDCLRINGDRLLTITLAANGRHLKRERVVCPATIRRELIWNTHKQAHAGVQRMVAKLQLRWYWLKMGHDVWLKVRQCEICQASKYDCLRGEAGRRRLYAGWLWQVVAVNLVGPMPSTPRGNSWILVLIDHFTRWADALAIPDTSVPTVAWVLDQNVFCYFVFPEQTHSDQSAQFQSQLMSDLCHLWEVNQSRTTLHHPQGNGVVERNNHMLGDALWSLLQSHNQEEWDTDWGLRTLMSLLSIRWGTGFRWPTTAGITDKPLSYSPSSWGPTWWSRLCLTTHTHRIVKGILTKNIINFFQNVV